jgi:2,4-dienoyl-CoA reductase-like NADH-dependent reductase (Old Yellow Enzyme family)/thioredoxin reductase
LIEGETVTKITDAIQIGKLTVSNRLMVPPMTTSFADTMGYPIEGAFNHYRQLAKGGWGFIQIEGTAVSWPFGAMFPIQFRLDDESYIPGLARIVDITHEQGIPCTIQLMYAGAMAQRWVFRIGFTAMGPSADYLPYRGMFGKVKELTAEQCEQVLELWVAAALRAKKTGADGITIHGATGNIPQQFMSPMSNHRTDKWGDRLAFATELVRRLREAVGPDFLIIYRIASDELIGEAGITIDWTVKEAIPTLEEAGKIDAWDVNPGFIGGPLNGLSPLIYYPQGVNLKYVTPLRQATSKPIIHAGHINDARFAISLIEEGKIDIVSIGRGALADSQFANKLFAGQYHEIRRCTFCGSSCQATRDPMGPISCAINPAFGVALEEMELKPAKNRKRIVVVGGGVGGMELARVAATRGHDVTLYEKDSKLGGQTRLASNYAQLGTEDLNNIVDWLSYQIKKAGVKIELGKETTTETITQLNPEVVVIATGSQTPMLDIPGIGRTNVGTIDDYLDQRLPAGNKVAIIGGGYGAECAISLARQGKEVTLIDESPKEKIAVTPYIPIYSGRHLYCMQNMGKESVKTLVQVKVKEIADRGVSYQDQGGNEQLLEVDTVIFALPRVPNVELANKLKGKIPEIYTLGDAVKPGLMHDTIHQAYALGKEI